MATATIQNTADNAKGNTSRKSSKPKNGVKARSVAKRKAKGRSSKGLGAQIYQQGQDAVSSVYDTASKATAKAGRALPNLRKNIDLRGRGQSLYSTMEDHPFVVGAVGLGVGMVLAALLPSGSISRHKH